MQDSWREQQQQQHHYRAASTVPGFDPPSARPLPRLRDDAHRESCVNNSGFTPAYHDGGRAAYYDARAYVGHQNTGFVAPSIAHREVRRPQPQQAPRKDRFDALDMLTALAAAAEPIRSVSNGSNDSDDGCGGGNWRLQRGFSKDSDCPTAPASPMASECSPGSAASGPPLPPPHPALLRLLAASRWEQQASSSDFSDADSSPGQEPGSRYGSSSASTSSSLRFFDAPPGPAGPAGRRFFNARPNEIANGRDDRYRRGCEVAQWRAPSSEPQEQEQEPQERQPTRKRDAAFAGPRQDWSSKRSRASSDSEFEDPGSDGGADYAFASDLELEAENTGWGNGNGNGIGRGGNVRTGSPSSPAGGGGAAGGTAAAGRNGKPRTRKGGAIWSAREDAHLTEMQSQQRLRNKWPILAGRLPGRSAFAVKKHWYAMRALQLQKGR